MISDGENCRGLRDEAGLRLPARDVLAGKEGLLVNRKRVLRVMREQGLLTTVEQAVLERLPAGSRGAGLTLATDNGTQFTSTRFLETLAWLEIIRRRTAYHHPEGHSYTERFHRELEGGRSWTGGVSTPGGSTGKHRALLGRVQSRPTPRGLRNRTPRGAMSAVKVTPKPRP